MFFASLFVCMYPINVKMAEQIRPKFCVGHVPMEGLGMIKISKNSLQQNSISIKFKKTY